MSYVYLFIAILTETLATLALKSSQGFTVLLPSLFVIVGYSIAFYCLSLTLYELPVGIVYATWCGVGIVFISLGAYLFHKQILDLYAWIGIIMIIVGVIFMNVLSKTPAE
jgi:small multidrug resistance pump